jgi:hypothetical protein
MNEIVSDGKRGFARYCKNRICAVCSGNRKADLINKYLPIVDSWKNPYFVTLTLKAVPAYKLSAIMRNMITGFQRIMDKHKKRHQRGKGIKLIGIRSFECNFNPKARTYNPHFHLIVPDKQTAILLLSEWRTYCNKKKFWASRKAQDMIEIYNNVKCLIEVIKYGSKIFTLKEDEEIETKIPPKIYVAALHNILCAMKGLRLFDSFGFRLSQKVKHKRFTILREYDILKYDNSVSDWIDSESELRLTNYVLPAELQNILEGRIDKVLE